MLTINSTEQVRKILARKKRSSISDLIKAFLVYKSENITSYEIVRTEFIKRYENLEPIAMRIFSNDNLIKSKFEMEKMFHNLVNTTMPLDRAFREVRRRTNAIVYFENKNNLKKFLHLIFLFIIHLLGNASFETIFNYIQN